LSRTSARALLAHHVDGDLDEVAHHRLDVAPDVADLGELRGLDLQERRLREPREPPRDLGLADAGRPDHQDVLRRDLLGQLGGSFWRRIRLRSAMATARFALCWPTTYLSSSATICRGVSDSTDGLRQDRWAWEMASSALRALRPAAVRVDADPAAMRIASSAMARASSVAVPSQRAGGGQRVRPARPDPDHPIVGLDEVAGCPRAGNVLPVHHDEHRLEPAEDAIGAPVLGELDGRALELPRYCSSFASKRENSANESAADPANPARIRSLYRRRIFRALCLTTVWPKVTWPSPAMTAYEQGMRVQP
jgi:hypothetical protein